MDIIFDNVTKNFPEARVLNDFCCVFKENKLNLLVGPSGKGKTTLLKLILGLINPEKGSIKGLDKMKIRACFQEDRLLEGSSVMLNLNLALDKKLSVEEISSLLKELGLNISPYEKVSALSGGMKRRIAVLRALLPSPDLLILDEAFTGMDSETAALTLSFILKMMDGKTIIASTHHEELFKNTPYNRIEI